MTEARALRFALKLPRPLLSPASLLDTRAPYSRSVVLVVAACVLTTLLVYLYAKTQDFGAKRQATALSLLAGTKSIDVRWDFGVLQARSDAAGPGPAIFERDDLVRIHRALDAAGRELPNPIQASVTELKQAYSEKAELIGRFVQANTDARQALAAAMRADAAVGVLVRGVWREFPQRERLVAAENLVARVLAEAQAYYQTPSAAHRGALQAYVADLSTAHALPRPVQAGLLRLESDIHQLLLLKPLEQTLWERMSSLTTSSRLDELTATLERRQANDIAARQRYRVYLLLYLVVLAVLGGYAGLRIVEPRRALEQRLGDSDMGFTMALHPFDGASTQSDPDRAA